jgi:hypothetical protein
MKVNPAPVQAFDICIAGWGLGSHNSMVPRDLEEALRLNPVINKLQIEVRWKDIKLGPGGPRIARKDQVKALTFFTEFVNVAEMRLELYKIYSSSNTDGFPLGKQLKYVPALEDYRYPATAKTYKNVCRLMAKQEEFLSNTVPVAEMHIKDIDFVVPDLGFPLREVLMAFRSSVDPDKALFISVDEQIWKSETTFLVHKDSLAEALQVIPYLCIILEAKFGPKIWDWFRDSAKHNLKTYYFDHIHQCIKNSDDEKWEDLSDDDDDLPEKFKGYMEHNNCTDNNSLEFEILIDLDGPVPKNQYNDDGTVKSFTTEVNQRQTKDEDDEDDESDVEMTDSLKSAKRKHTPASIDTTAANTPASTITEPPDDDILTKFNELMQDPAKLAQLMSNESPLQALLKKMAAAQAPAPDMVTRETHAVDGSQEETVDEDL